MAIEEAIGDATLQDETLAELGLSAQPFVDNKNSRFSDSTAQKVRAAMEQHLRFGESLHLFIGEQGVGKTVFLSQLIKHCKSSIKPFVAKGTDSFETVSFLSAVLTQLGGDQADTISDHVDALIPLFEELADDKMSVVLAIDDAHLAPIEEIAELIDIMPSFCKENGDKTARLLLTGEPKLQAELTAIADEFEDELSFEHATTTLQPLDESRVREYLTTKLNQAGHTDAFPFTDKSISKIHRESKGLPENINALAGKYLNTVYSGGAATAGGKGFFAALGWPLLALGTAAVALIAWGMSMFFGNDKPDATIAQNTAEIIEPVAGNITEQADTTVISTDTSGVVPGDAVSNDLVVDNSNINTTVNTDSDNTQLVTPTINEASNSLTTATANGADDLLKPADREVVTQPEVVQPEIVQPAATEAVTAIVENTPEIPDTGNLVDSVTDTATDASSTVTEQIIAVAPATQQVTEQVTDSIEQITTSPTTAVQPEVPGSVAVTVPNNTSGNTTASNNPGSDDNQAAAITLDGSNDTDATSVAATDDNGGIAVAIDDINTGVANQAAGVQTTIQNAGSAVVAGSGDLINGVQVPVDAAPAINRAIENERWVLFQAPTKFTVQLATSRERGYIIDLAQKLEAEDPVAIYPFLTTNSQNPVFGLLSGLYETRSEAIAAVDRMATDTKQFGVWIRPISDLQAAIKKQR